MNKQLTPSQTQEFNQVLNQVQQAKHQAYQQLNKGLVSLYWAIGQYISQQVKDNHWGKGVVEQLATFIQNKEPDIQGFNARNLWLMKQFYETYQLDTKLYTLCTELSWSHNRRIMSLKTNEEREFYS